MPVRHGKRYYKQMALEVAVRNPERYEDILRVFKKFEGKVLNDSTILDMYVALYMDGALDANDLPDNYNEADLKEYIINNKSHNNEWGFPTGYQAAFVRYCKTLSEFGFIYSQYNEELKISEVSKKLLNGTITLSEAFAVQSLRFWRMSPYRRVLNDYNYFEFIYKALIKRDEQGHKISYPQLMYSLFSDDGNVDEYINTLDNNKIGSDLEKAYDLVLSNYKGKSELHQEPSKLQTAFRDYGNTVFRVLQLTGFINVDYSGVILLSINKNRLPFLNDLLKYNFRITESAKEDYLEYFNLLGSFSNDLENCVLSHREAENYSTLNYNAKIPHIIDAYGLTKESVAEYLSIVSSKGKEGGRPFWFIQAPIKFEFLLTLYAYLCFGDSFEYEPNYKCDDNGIPYSHAPGNIGDIEVYNNSKYWLIEATLITSKQQQSNYETVNLFRHINEKASGVKYLSLIAPKIHDDTSMILRASTLISMVENNEIGFYSQPQTTEDFIQKCNDDIFGSIESYSKVFIKKIKRISR